MVLEPVQAKIGGHEYKVVFDLNSMAAMHRAIKRGHIDTADITAAKMSNVAILALFWTGLATFHPDLSLHEFRARHAVEDMKAITAALNTAENESTETVPEAEAKNAFPTNGSQ